MPRSQILTWQVCLLTLFAKIKIITKISELTEFDFPCDDTLHKLEDLNALAKPFVF